MSELQTLLKQILEVPPPLALSLAINFILTFLGMIPQMSPWKMNAAAFVMGVTFWPMLSDPGKVGYAVRSPMASQIIEGLLIGGFSIGSHQLFINALKRIGFFTAQAEAKAELKEAVKEAAAVANVTGADVVIIKTPTVTSETKTGT